MYKAIHIKWYFCTLAENLILGWFIKKKYTAIGINFGLIYFSLITENIRLICYHFEIFW